VGPSGSEQNADRASTFATHSVAWRSRENSVSLEMTFLLAGNGCGSQEVYPKRSGVQGTKATSRPPMQGLGEETVTYRSFQNPYIDFLEKCPRSKRGNSLL